MAALEQRLFPGWFGSEVESGPSPGLASEPAPSLQASRAYPSITSLRIPRIDLESEVIPSPLVELPQGVTWSVPPFKVGHADGTAQAGSTLTIDYGFTGGFFNFPITFNGNAGEMFSAEAGQDVLIGLR